MGSEAWKTNNLPARSEDCKQKSPTKSRYISEQEDTQALKESLKPQSHWDDNDTDNEYYIEKIDHCKCWPNDSGHTGCDNANDT